MLRLTFLIGTLAAANFAWALPNGFHQILAFGDHDTRQTYSDYARSHGLKLSELQKTLSATGYVRCDLPEHKMEIATANLTVTESVVTTVNHIFCAAERKPEQCQFIYFNGKKSVAVAIRADSEVGQPCTEEHEDIKDWAVLRLASPAKGPTPYPIDLEAVRSSQVGTPLRLAANMAMDFCLKDKNGNCQSNPKTKTFTFPKYVVDCAVEDIAPNLFSVEKYITNCPAAPGASGAAVLQGDIHSPVLVGLHVGESESDDDLAYEHKNGLPVIRPYTPPGDNHWLSVEVAIHKALANALLQAVLATRNPAQPKH